MTQLVSTLEGHRQRLGTNNVDVDGYRAAVEALYSASESGQALEDQNDLIDLLITQPAQGQHQLAHYVCHLATSGLPYKAAALVAALEFRLVSLLNNLNNLDASAQRRTVLFAVTARTFITHNTLTQDRISGLHLAYFTRFEIQDLDLPYSILFSVDIFGRNRDDLLTHYMMQGHLTSLKDLTAQHVLLLAWLSQVNPLSGPVTLTDIVSATDVKDAKQNAALRSLIMRFGAGSGGIEPGIITDLGLETLTFPTVYNSHPAHLARLDSLARKAASIASHRVRAKVPFLATLQRKPKIALCLSGQLRGYQSALKSWKARLYPTIEPHVFVHSWSDIGRSEAAPSRSVLPFAGAAFTKAYQEVGVTTDLATLKSRYPTLFKKLAEGATVTQAQLQTTYDTDHVVLEDDKSEKFAHFTNQQKMHYKIHAADELARAKGGFDLILRIRPDLSIRDLAFSWSALRAALQDAPLLFAERGYGLHYGMLMIGDQFAIGSPDAMKTYANTWTTFPNLAARNFYKVPAVFTGHVSLAQTCWLQGLDVRRAPVRFGHLEDAAKLSARDCMSAMETDNTGTPDDLKLLAAASNDI